MAKACGENEVCVECGSKAHHRHHVVPQSLGGTFTVPLCTTCHAKVHGRRAMADSTLIKAGIARARAEGKKIGGSNKGRLIACTEEVAVQIRVMKAEGKGVSWIARHAKVSRPTVYRILGAAG
jgi:hypothetical protein